MCSNIVFAISLFAISSALGEPIRLDLLRRGGTGDAHRTVQSAKLNARFVCSEIIYISFEKGRDLFRQDF